MSINKHLNQEDSSKQRQDDELISINAIFPDEVKDLRLDKAWKTWKPLELLISVSPDSEPTESEEVTTAADLYIKCSIDYPNAVPFIDIKNSKGLSVQDVVELKKELLVVAKQNIGQEMVLELIQCSRAYLSDHKKPHYKSFYEEMVFNQQQQQKQIAERQMKEKEAEKIAEQKKMLAIEQEKNRKLEALKNAHRQSRIQDDTSGIQRNSPEAVSTNGFKRSRSHSESSCKDVCTGTVKTTMKFSGKKELSVFCGQCLNHNKRGCVVYCGMETTSGDLVFITKWMLQWLVSQKQKMDELETVKKEQSVYLKQLVNMEQEFRTLRQLKHENLVLYLGMNYVQRKDKIDVFILQEYVPGCSLAQMAKGIPLSIQQLQLYTRDILQALQYLHENSVVHKNIRETSIFICRDGRAKLSDYSLDKKMYDIYRSLTNVPEIDIYPPTIGKGGKKSDVYRLGVILLSLSVGSLSKDIAPKIPPSLNPSFRDFLSKCLIHNEQERWSADQLLSHPFVAYSSLHNILPKESEIKHIEEDDDLPVIPMLKGECSSGSRLMNEFEILKCLGKGGFGYVLKVKNKLDSRVYALKRIPLNPSNKLLDRKIKREVKLLSRLNHENIVRYYNSWIEETSSLPFTADGCFNKDPTMTHLSKDLEQSTASSLVQWEMHKNDKDDAFSSDDEDDDYDLSLAFRQDSNSSSSIIFEDDGKFSVCEDTKDEQLNSVSVEHKEKLKCKVERFMYIQMEFCEKSTLRTAIDNSLYKDVPLVWRLFREIVEGLHYIHQQGVIHRDLKPVNIFLDSQDHVKIGDFGLATDVISKPVVLDFNASADFSISEQLQHSYSDAIEDGFRTGNVGTALYVAPEVASSNAKLTYTHKVDIYSLGIILFEMCYPPPLTVMERVKLIMNLRQPDISFPVDMEEQLSAEMMSLLLWLLQHDPTKRPNSAELIASDYIPPLLMEETELHNVIRNTVSKPQNRTYKFMINSLFNQEIPTEFDFTYDMDEGQSVINKTSEIFCSVVDTLNKILRKHGAVNYSVPTLMPKSQLYDNDTCVYVMERGGGIVNLPHDLRVPFARHVARKEITNLKRFTLEKVYREQKVFGCHPREQYEYAFDIVTPTPCNFMPDAEIISAVSEIITEFSSLESRNYMICLNHVSLFKAIILYCSVDKATELQIYDVLESPKNRNASKLQLQNQLLDLDIPDKTVSKLIQFVDISDSFEKVVNMFQPLSQTRGEISLLTKKAFKELKIIITLSEAFGVKLPILVCPGLSHEIQLFSGVMFQFLCHSKLRKKKLVKDILAAGGRYDKLITSFKLKSMSEGSRAINQSAVGVSIAVERIVSAEFENADCQSLISVDVLVHAIDLEMANEKSSLLKELWALGYSASAFYDKHLCLDDAVDFCRNHSVSHLLIISKTEPGVVKIRTFEKEKISEKKICFSELKDHLPKFVNSSKSSVDYNQTLKVEYQRTSSLSISSSSSISVMSVRFLPQDKTHNNRKREPNIRSHVQSTLMSTSSRAWEIVAVDLKMNIIGAIVSYCDIGCNEESIHKAFDIIADSYSKYKKYLSLLAEEICDIKTKNKNSSSSIILYSLPESNFRVIL